MAHINPKVIDISHYDRVVGNGFQSVRQFGIVGVIQKSSEGTSIVDSVYTARVPAILAAGLLLGAYHFMRAGNVKEQVDLFLRVVKPNDKTLLALDYEVDNIPLVQAQDFVEQVERAIGRSIVVYSGNTIKEKLANTVNTFWGSRRLWLAQYANNWVVQRSWTKPWLWQYTGDGVGPQPHNVPGISIAGGLDISSYDGTDDQLAKEWATGAIITPVELRDTKWVQAALNKLGYTPPLKVDGLAGPATTAYIRVFQTREGLVADGIAGPITIGALEKALTSPAVVVAAPPTSVPVPTSPREIMFSTSGKMSTFGGPKDEGVGDDEGIALYMSAQQAEDHGIHLLSPAAAGAQGLARRLDPKTYYLACRWPTDKYPFLRDAAVHVEANGKSAVARAVDWGPNVDTGRVADLSPALAEYLGLDTNDVVKVTVYADGK